MFVTLSSTATVESHWIALSDEVLLKVWKVLPEGAHHRLNTFSLALCNNLGYEWMYRVSVAMNSSSSLIMKKPIDDMVTMFHTVGLVAERERKHKSNEGKYAHKSDSFNSLENGIGSSKWDSLKLAKDRFCVTWENGMVAMNKLYDIANILVESIDTFDLEVDKMSFNDLDTNRINHEKTSTVCNFVLTPQRSFCVCLGFEIIQSEKTLWSPVTKPPIMPLIPKKKKAQSAHDDDKAANVDLVSNTIQPSEEGRVLASGFRIQDEANPYPHPALSD
ncbi:hypothetical protein EDC96DRAFT_569239 [Choanephora cucurbitarum]|nr:hypothetical protein EDC96DRAFT_569239 [Choanephora cucurbitarum]